MSKFIRTNEGIYELKENMTIETGIYRFFGKIYNTSEKHLFRNDKDLGEFVSQGDTIEELIQDNDIIYIHDLYPDAVLVVEGNIKPFGYNNSIKLKEWLKFKFTEFDLYIKQPNEDYHKIASKKQYEKLVLI